MDNTIDDQCYNINSQKTVLFVRPIYLRTGSWVWWKMAKSTFFFQKHDHAHMKIYLGDGCVSPVNPQAKLRFSLRVSKGLARKVKGPQTERVCSFFLKISNHVTTVLCVDLPGHCTQYLFWLNSVSYWLVVLILDFEISPLHVLMNCFCLCSLHSLGLWKLTLTLLF